MRASVRRAESPVRWREDAFEFRCSACGEWWPLTLEFWRPQAGVRRCIACQNERRREAYDPVRHAINARRQWRSVCRRRQLDPEYDRRYRERQRRATEAYAARRYSRGVRDGDGDMNGAVPDNGGVKPTHYRGPAVSLPDSARAAA